MSFKTSFWANLLSYLVGKIVFSIITIFILIVLVGVAIASFDFSEEAEEVKLNEKSILYIALQGDLVNRKDENLLSAITQKEPFVVSLQEIHKALVFAKNDSLVSAVLLDFSGLQTGFANVEELRNEIISFKNSGKKVYSYANNYSQSEYYLASCADFVWLNPQGGVEFKGLSVKYLFFKNLLSKLGIQPEIFRQGKYKSAIEPFEADSMSVASKEQSLQLIESIWGNALQKMATQRKTRASFLNDLADSLVLFNTANALKHNLIDAVYYKDEVENKLAQFTNKNKPYITVSNYLKLKNSKTNEHAQNTIAVLYAEGEIIDGKGENNQIGDYSFSEELKKIRKDSTVKALVIRVNSPGGSAQASENILREIELCKAKMPVVVSMGDVAASGGYYISCKADAIFAQPNTITGSIGVFGLLFNMQSLFEDKLGVNFDAVNTNKHSDFPAFDRKISSQEKELIQQQIAMVYETFKKRVSEGRNISMEMADSLGRGRVWSGIDAKQKGLVDYYGGLQEAISFAAKKANISSYKTTDFPENDFQWKEVLMSLSSVEIQKIIKENFAREKSYSTVLKLFQQIRYMKGIQTRLPGEIIIE